MKCTYLWAHTHTWSNSPQLFQHLYLDATASLIWLVLSLIPTFQQMAQINWLLFVFYLNAASAAKQLIFEFVLNIRELFLAVIFHMYLSCGSVNLLHINNSSLTPRNYILLCVDLNYFFPIVAYCLKHSWRREDAVVLDTLQRVVKWMQTGAGSLGDTWKFKAQSTLCVQPFQSNSLESTWSAYQWMSVKNIQGRQQWSSYTWPTYNW